MFEDLCEYRKSTFSQRKFPNPDHTFQWSVACCRDPEGYNGYNPYNREKYSAQQITSNYTLED